MIAPDGWRTLSASISEDQSTDVPAITVTTIWYQSFV